MQSGFHCSLGHPYSPREDVRLSVIHHMQTSFTTRYPNGDFFFFLMIHHSFPVVAAKLWQYPTFQF